MSGDKKETTEDKTVDEALPFSDRVVERIRTVYDPEIPVNLYDLGLIYNIDVTAKENGKYDVKIVMTLTSPNCPIAEEIPLRVKEAVSFLEEVDKVAVDIVWDPPWDMSRMSDEARLQLNMI